MKPNANLLGSIDASPTVRPAVPIYNELTPELLEGLVSAGGWHLVLGEGGRAELATANGELRVRILDGGTIWYAVQLSYLPLSLTAGGEYTVTFQARARTPQPMILDIAQVGSWYSYCPRTDFAIGTDWQEFALHFGMGPAASETRARFEFNLGHGAPNEVFFREVRVEPAAGGVR